MDIKLLKQLNNYFPEGFKFEKKGISIHKDSFIGLYITFEGDSISYIAGEGYTISIRNKTEFNSTLFFAQLKEVLSENTEVITKEIERIKEGKREKLKEELSLLED